MKLLSVSICNMHKISSKHAKEYALKDISYFVGPNGSGKSTALQAIQLALLGYIPGYGKTNADIMKHSNDGKFIEVTVALEEAGSIYTVCRRWEKSGVSIKGSVKVTPEEFDPKSIIGEIELPVFNFNEFKGMTANKLKEWFINFLPKDEFAIDWREYLISELGSRSILCSEELMEGTLSKIAELEARGLKGVELVKNLNDYLKSEQSFEKSTVERLQGTVNSMIYYAEAEELDREEIQDRSTQLRSLRDAVIQYNTQMQSIEDIQQKLSQIKLGADCIENDPEMQKLMAELKELDDSVTSAANEVNELRSKFTTKNAELSQIGTATSDICPYTKVKCAEMTVRLSEIAEKRTAVIAEITELKSAMNTADLKYQQINCRRAQIQHTASVIADNYKQAAALKSSLPSMILTVPTSRTVQEIDSELEELQNQLIQIAANKKFNELNATITADKYRAENKIEVLKTWISSTGANGLQTYMMEKPFESLAADLSKYLSSMYGHEVEGKFKLEEKANSFSFGINHAVDGTFVEFDLLSSGEKCLFTIALIVCLINRTNSALKLILADDIFDHLDDENANRFFAGLSAVGIQCILAGVKECKDTSICIEVGGN